MPNSKIIANTFMTGLMKCIQHATVELILSLLYTHSHNTEDGSIKEQQVFLSTEAQSESNRSTSRSYWCTLYFGRNTHTKGHRSES